MYGKFLSVNLSRETVDELAIPNAWMEKHLGGRGIAARVLLDRFGPEFGAIDPLGETNALVFATGPLTGTGIAGASRMAVMAKSPKTKTLNESYVGGHFPHEVGRSGYDGIIITGKAASPKYLSIGKGRPEILDASALWGQDTAATEDLLQRRHGRGARVAAIGPAGENLVSMACIMVDRTRAAGRPGLGSVMGSKKLKAIVVQGTKEKPIADPQRLNAAASGYAKLVMEYPYSKSLHELGSAGGSLEYYNQLGILPTRNFRDGTFQEVEKISGQALKKLLYSRDTCHGCPVACKRVVKSEVQGEKILPKHGGPEFETLVAFGSLCMNGNLDWIALANQKCNQYGLDTISAGVAVAFLMEASERGLISEKISWGDGPAIARLVDEIALCKGLGGRLRDGIGKLARDIGAEDCAMLIKGQEMPMHDPRGKASLAITYATTPRGAQHMEGMHDTLLEAPPLTPELGVTVPLERHSFADKAKIAKTYEDFVSFNNSLVLCAYTYAMTGASYNHGEIRKILEYVTGRAFSIDECMAIGERNYVLLKVGASLAGYSRQDDRLPDRFYDPIPSGPEQGRRVAERVLQESIDEYYELRGFDNRGPTVETLRRLDLGDLIPLVEVA